METKKKLLGKDETTGPRSGAFQALPPDSAGVLSWLQIGDLHLTAAGEQNHLDLRRIIAEVNRAFAGKLSFVYLPGDQAEHGDAAAYAVLRPELDRLQVPWCAIVGDHDVQSESFDNFSAALGPELRFAFTAGTVRFVGMNAFERPHPASFFVSDDQLRWAEAEFEQANATGHTSVLLLHCYPSDLKTGGEALSALLRRYGVRVVAMGHTHYNEVSNDGTTLYIATRSTGQIEEGPAGFSVTCIDGDAVSWRFFPLDELPAVVITSPADRRLQRDDSTAIETGEVELRVRAKIFSAAETLAVTAALGDGAPVRMERIAGSEVWEAALPLDGVAAGVYPLHVEAEDADGNRGEDEIEIRLGATTESAARLPRDQDNALPAWEAHGLLGTQLGPNKNGRKW